MNLLAKIGKLSPYIFAITVPIFIVLVLIHNLFLTSPINDPHLTKYIIIPENTSAPVLASLLAENNFVKNSFVSKILIDRQVRKMKKELNIRAGEYEISPNSLPAEVISQILTNEPIERSFNLTPGMTTKDICNSITSSGLFSIEEIENAMTKPELLIRHNIAASVPEGYLVPMIARFKKPITSEIVAESLVRSGEVKRKERFPTLDKIASSFNLDEYKILIIASLIEKSGAKDMQTKKNVSSVIHNKITLKIPLNDEMALKYQSNDFNRKISLEEKSRLSPYNTFKKEGLPPTPICNPSFESIEAALTPADTDLLYYVLSPSGNLEFSTTEAGLKKQNLNN